MNIFSKVTWNTLWRNRVRTWVTIIGIILSTAMFMAVCTMSISLWDFMVREAKANYGNYHLRYDYMTDAQLDALAEDARVKSLSDWQALGYYFPKDDSDAAVLAAVEPSYFTNVGVTTVSGSRLPKNSSEILLPNTIARAQNLEIGDSITLELYTHGENLPEEVPVAKNAATFSKTYTIVGISYNTQVDMQGDLLAMESAITLADGNQGDALWHRGFVQCAPNKAIALGREGYGPNVYVNKPLLAYYNISEYQNESKTIFSLAAILLAIIMVASVSLIYNAFSISVSQRKQQFGLLASVGATKAQLRGMVYREALYLSLPGICVGLAAGYGGLAITMGLLRQRMDAFLSTGIRQQEITLHLVFSPYAVVAAGVIALMTVLLSAWIPARRATKVSPMDCIRQSGSYKTRKKAIRVGLVTEKLFGLPGMLAKKYFKVSKGKYRPTVLSLAISVALFISATGYTRSMQLAANQNIQVENYDIYCFYLPDIHELPMQKFVSKYAWHKNQNYTTYLPDESYSEEALEFMTACQKGDYSYYIDFTSRNTPGVTIHYLQDDVLRAFLNKQGIDPEPYFRQEEPLALVAQQRFTVDRRNADGSLDRLVFTHAPLDENVQTLPLLPTAIPIQQLQSYTPWANGDTTYDIIADSDGSLAVVIDLFENYVTNNRRPSSSAVTFPMELSKDSEGHSIIKYYLLEPETGIISPQPIVQEVVNAPVFRLGEVIDEMPFGLNGLDGSPNLNLILPLSLAEHDAYGPVLSINVSDHAAAIEWLEAQGAGYTDHRAAQETNRTLLLVIQVFSYGFIILISLICASNVFNTVSTNIQLRRRDFASLKSVGMSKGDLRKMLVLECITYGCRALLYGLPVGLALCWLIHRKIARRTGMAAFTPPWGPIMIAALCVFAVVFASMLYAGKKLNQQDPIDAIRQENI